MFCCVTRNRNVENQGTPREEINEEKNDNRDVQNWDDYDIITVDAEAFKNSRVYELGKENQRKTMEELSKHELNEKPRFPTVTVAFKKSDFDENGKVLNGEFDGLINLSDINEPCFCIHEPSSEEDADYRRERLETNRKRLETNVVRVEKIEQKSTEDAEKYLIISANCIPIFKC